MRNALIPGPRPWNFPRENLIETIAETSVMQKKLNNTKKFAKVKQNIAKLRFLFLQLIVDNFFLLRVK